MKNLYLITAVIFALFMFACEDENVVKTYENIHVTANIPMSRTLYSEENGITYVSWEVDDAIGINTFHQENLEYHSQTAGYQADFYPLTEKLYGMDGDSVFAYYPYSAESTIDSIYIGFSNRQYYKKNGSEKDILYAKGVIQNNELMLNFQHLFAFLKITIPKERFVDVKDGIIIMPTSDYNDQPISAGGFYYPPNYPVSKGNDIWIEYVITEDDFKNEEELVCYIAILPQPENVELIFNRRSDSKNIFVRRVPSGGFKAGNVYALTLSSKEELEQEQKKERDALIAFYNATNGDEWTNNENWCSDKPVNEWYGVSMNYTGDNIERINLGHNNLCGVIPEEIKDLKSLEVLSLWDNNICEIPFELRTLTSLSILNLRNNQLEGSIPEFLGDLKLLSDLDLSNNQLEGSIPEFLGDLKLLSDLDLSNNQLEGNIPECLGNLKLLSSLNLSSNQLSGKIPDEICNLSLLEKINLSYNQLEGNIPECLGDLKLLSSLDLSVNQLSGKIPDEICNLSLLEKIYLNYNKFTGSIPEKIDNLTQLRRLYLEMNELTGILPVSIAKMENLSAFRVWGNFLNGEICEEILNCNNWKNVWNIYEIIPQKKSCKLIVPQYVSSDYSRDGEVYLLQKHTKGKGIKIVLTGDGYSDRLINDGTFDKHMRQRAYEFFSEEPFASFRDYFDVYVYVAVSKNEDLGYTTAFDSKYTVYDDGRIRLVSDEKLIINRLKDALSYMNKESLSNVLTIMVLNSPVQLVDYCSMYIDGFSIAYIRSNSQPLVLKHEACGHGFAFLLDEYVEYEGSPDESFYNFYNQGYFRNVDVTANPNDILWSHFLNDVRYVNENIGIYEGALYEKGIYRSTLNSIMNPGGSIKSKFNAPSRWAIYQRIMKLAGEDCNFDDFLEYDSINRLFYDNNANSRAIYTFDVDCDYLKSSPILHNYPSSSVTNQWRD